jgi:cytochrome c biogenesis protein CcmG/thiol:disulfide interchange protein DsbE
VTKKLAVLIAAIGLVAALYLHRRASRAGAPNHDLPAPAVALADLSGKDVSPAHYKGEVVLINFWAAWCTPCREEIPQFVTLQDKYGSQGFQAIGISFDDPEAALRDFCREYKVNYPIVMGSQKIAEGFGGVLGLPTTFLIGRDGRMRSKHVGATDFLKLEREITALLAASR